ncbi:MAG: phosphoribosylaminoimidazolesuccinocarboxamide synthase [Eggerthellaceae bacterium]
MTGIDIKPDAQGKVRDLYDLGDKLLLVATDRISAFDYIRKTRSPQGAGHAAVVLLVRASGRRGGEPSHLSDVADLPEQFSRTPTTCAAASCW